MFLWIVFCFSFFSYIDNQIFHHIYNPEYVLIFHVDIMKIRIKNSIYSSTSKNISDGNDPYFWCGLTDLVILAPSYINWLNQLYIVIVFLLDFPLALDVVLLNKGSSWSWRYGSWICEFESCLWRGVLSILNCPTYLIGLSKINERLYR